MFISRWRAPRTVFAACNPVTGNTAALELRAAVGRVGIAFGSTGLPVQFPLPRHWPSPVRVGRVTERSPDHAAMGLAASPSPVRDQAERDQTRHASLMRRARSSGRFRRSRDAKLFGPP